MTGKTSITLSAPLLPINFFDDPGPPFSAIYEKQLMSPIF